jgi:hypothetical protein
MADCQRLWFLSIHLRQKKISSIPSGLGEGHMKGSKKNLNFVRRGKEWDYEHIGLEGERWQLSCNQMA